MLVSRALIEQLLTRGTDAFTPLNVPDDLTIEFIGGKDRTLEICVSSVVFDEKRDIDAMDRRCEPADWCASFKKVSA